MKKKRKLMAGMLSALLVMSSFTGVLMADELDAETLEENSEAIEEVECADEVNDAEEVAEVEETEETTEETSDDTISESIDETSDEDIVFENVEDEETSEEISYSADYSTSDINADTHTIEYVYFSEGTCGPNVKYTLYADIIAPTKPVKAVIYTTGTNGEMDDYQDGETSPFYYDSLKEVSIGKGVVHIGSNAFAHCTSLTDISIASSVISIGDRAFYFCTNLKNFQFPLNLTHIGRYAFAYSGIVDVILYTPLDYCGERAFINCKSLNTVSFKTNETEIASELFRYDSNLKKVNFVAPNAKKVGTKIFDGCKGLTTVAVSCLLEDEIKNYTSSYKIIHSYDGLAYSKCNSCSKIRPIADIVCGDKTWLTFVDIDNDTVYETCYLKGTGKTYDYFSDTSPLWNEPGITSVKVEDTVTYVGNYMFYGMKDLVSVELPRDLQTLSRGLFYKCDKLSYVNIPECIIEIADYSFYNCSSLKTIVLPKGIKVIKDYAFYGSGLEKIDLPEGLERIETCGFSSCQKLTEITIPSTVDQLGYSAFSGCYSLVNVYILSESKDFRNNNAMPAGNSLKNIYISCNIKNQFNGLGSLLRIDHKYDNKCDTTCNYCGEVRTASNHVYDNDVDATCNECGAKRAIDPVLGFASRLYTTCLGRSADKDGIEYWVKELKNGKSGSEAAYKFFFGNEFTKLNLTNDEYLNRLYRTFMGREADNAGKSYWLTQISKGSTRLDVFNGFVKSAEWKKVCADYGINPGEQILNSPEKGPATVSGAEVFATRLYTTCLGRNPDANGLKDWVAKLESHKVTGTQAAHGFFFSKEFTSKNYSNDEYIKRLYRTFMGREADANGLSYWQGKFKSGYTREQVFQGFAKSAEFASLCKQYGIIA